MTTLLQAIQTAAKRCGVNYSISSVIGSTDNNIIQLLTKMEEAGKAIRDFADWPELQKEYTFTLSTSTASYALPGDFGRIIDQTEWNRSQTQPLYGPVSPDQWQYLKSGIVSLSANERFRVKGFTDAQFYIDPTPDSGHNGDTCAYEYITNTWIKPKTWVTGVAFAASSYCSYNGNIYSTVAGGTTGATPPTHTSGSASDGTVTWVYYSAAYESFVADTDQLILDSEHIINGTVWRWKMENGYAFEPFMNEAMERLNQSKADLNGASIVDFKRANTPYLLDIRGLPESGYG